MVDRPFQVARRGQGLGQVEAGFVVVLVGGEPGFELGGRAGRRGRGERQLGAHGLDRRIGGIGGRHGDGLGGLFGVVLIAFRRAGGAASIAPCSLTTN